MEASDPEEMEVDQDVGDSDGNDLPADDMDTLEDDAGEDSEGGQAVAAPRKRGKKPKVSLRDAVRAMEDHSEMEVVASGKRKGSDPEDDKQCV